MYKLWRYTQFFLNWQGNPIYLFQHNQTTMGRLHRTAAKHALSTIYLRFSYLRQFEVIILCLLTLFWPLRLIAQSIRYLKFYGYELDIEKNIPLSIQFVEMVKLGVLYGLPPGEYYNLQLYRACRRQKIEEYFFNHEVRSFLPFINNYISDNSIEDKIVFAKKCQANRLPVIPTIISKATSKEVYNFLQWPPGDYISKPTNMSAGRGVLLWRSYSEGIYAGIGGVIAHKSSLSNIVDKMYDGRPWLLQPKIINHRHIADLSTGSAITVRLMTAYLGDQDIKIFSALLKIPTGNAVTNTDGIGSNIDLTSGILGPAFPYDGLHQGFDHHPTTRNKIKGRIVPCWREIKDLAITAHSFFPTTRLIGWDIAILDTGPALLEANTCWDALLPQIAMQKPFGETMFVDIIEEIFNQNACK